VEAVEQVAPAELVVVGRLYFLALLVLVEVAVVEP
jgi:hypothetical protein